MERPSHCRVCGQKFSPTKKRVPGLAVHVSRGLCTKCEAWVREHGGTEYFPRLTVSYESMREEWEVLKQDGFTKYRAAQVLGLKYENFLAAVARTEK